MLDAAAIRACVDNVWAGAEVRVLGSVTSTNDIAWAWAEAGCAEGTVVLAEEQVRGRGRFGRIWHSPRGRGLLMSVVLRPCTAALSPTHITAIGALAAAEAIEAESGLSAGIRWPNDLTIGGRKVGGILVERRGTGPSPCIVGIGINVNTRAEEFPKELRPVATSLAIEAGKDFSRERLAGAVLRALQASYREALGGRWGDSAALWRRRLAMVGQLVTIRSRGAEWRGRLLDADPLCGVELLLPGGERETFRAEDTTLIVD